MKQRIKMATALVHDPTVLLLDEPFNGMDPRQRLHLMDLLHRLGDEGRTVLFSSHILEEVEQIAGRIEVMVAGPPRGVRRLPRDPAADDRSGRTSTRSAPTTTARSPSAVIADGSTSGVELVADGTDGTTAVHVQATDFAAFVHALPAARLPPRHPAARGPPGRRVARVASSPTWWPDE